MKKHFNLSRYKELLKLEESGKISFLDENSLELLSYKVREDPKYPLTEKEKNLLQRAEKYKEYKEKFYQNNPDIDRDEL